VLVKIEDGSAFAGKGLQGFWKPKAVEQKSEAEQPAKSECQKQITEVGLVVAELPNVGR